MALVLSIDGKRGWGTLRPAGYLCRHVPYQDLSLAAGGHLVIFGMLSHELLSWVFLCRGWLMG